MRYGMALIIWLIAMMQAACGGMRVAHEGALPGRFAGTVPIVVIAEPELTYGADPAETFARAADIVDGFTTAGVPSVAPWELDVPRGVEWPHGRSAVVALLGEHGIDSADAVVARLIVEHDGATRAVVSPASMGGGVRVFADVDVTVRLELSDATSREVLHTVIITYREDPTRAGVDEFDVRPMLREAVVRSAAEAAGALLDAGGLQQVDADLPVTRWGAWHALEYGGGVGQPERAGIEELDALDAEVARFNVYRRYDATVDPELVDVWERDRGGLVIVDPAGWHNLQAGDRVVRIDGDPAAGRHVLLRAASRADGQRAVAVEVVGQNGLRVVDVRPIIQRMGPGAAP